MAPIIKVTKESIIDAATDIVRKEGASSLNARRLAAYLKCSTQPIFFNFSSMDEVKFAVIARAYELCNEYIRLEIEKGEATPYKASGLAYIRFAREEKELFKLLYMRDRSDEKTENDDNELNRQMERMVTDNTGLENDAAKLFHLEIWAFVHGIAVMTATGFLDLEWSLISKMISDNYFGLKSRFCKE